MQKEKKSFLQGKDPKKFSKQLWIIVVASAIMVLLMLGNYSSTKEITMKRFERMIKKKHVKEVVVVRNKKQVEVTIKREHLAQADYAQDIEQRSPLFSNEGPHYKITITTPESFEDRFREIQQTIPPEEQLEYKVEDQSDFFSVFFNYGIFFIIFIVFWFLIRRMAGSGGMGGGGQIFNIGKSQAIIFDRESKIKITFKDIAGLDEAKAELEEIVEFLRNPDKFTKLGGKIPKGALLMGSPGTGKTLLAKAVAGEAAVDFFSLSGSDFVEMFVGVGAARVRDLFKRAKSKAPCIVFIDEIDAIGRSRGKQQSPVTNDERENTLNSLLVEMDGFSTNSGVIILAATNRPDVLDHALLRPGRFDRQISIDKPDIAGREAIFKVHLVCITVEKGLDIKTLALQTRGFSGAEIANICNEAALIAARKNKKKVMMQDFQDAIDRIIGGLEKKNKVISSAERDIVAYHEAGHAVVGWFLEHANPLVKVSIVPRGTAALGYAQYLPKEQFLYQTDQLKDEMCMTLGGRVAEEIVFKKISTGALNDLEKVTKIAYGMVTLYGMSEALGNISYHNFNESEMTFNRPYSEATAQLIDREVQQIVQKVYARATTLLKKRRKMLDIIAKELLKKEIIFESDVEKLIGARPFGEPKKTTVAIKPKTRGTKVATAKKARKSPSTGQGTTAKKPRAVEDKNQ